MAEMLLESKSPPGVHRMDLAVRLSKMKVTVEAGTVVFKRKSYEVQEETFEATTRPEKTLLNGYLVVDKSSDEMRVFVDDVVMDGVDAAYSFKSNPDLQLFAKIFWVEVPGDTTNLSGLDHRRWRIIEDLPQEES
jgi:hypothetical protein